MQNENYAAILCGMTPMSRLAPDFAPPISGMDIRRGNAHGRACVVGMPDAFRRPPQRGSSAKSDYSVNARGCDHSGTARVATGQSAGATREACASGPAVGWIRIPDFRLETLCGSDRRPIGSGGERDEVVSVDEMRVYIRRTRHGSGHT